MENMERIASAQTMKLNQLCKKVSMDATEEVDKAMNIVSIISGCALVTLETMNQLRAGYNGTFHDSGLLIVNKKLILDFSCM